MGHEGHFELTVDVHLIVFEYVCLRMLRHRETKCLTDYVVKWNGQKESSKQK